MILDDKEITKHLDLGKERTYESDGVKLTTVDVYPLLNAVLDKLKGMGEEDIVDIIAEHIYNWKCSSLIEYEDQIWGNLADKTKEFYRIEARKLLSKIIPILTARHQADKEKAVKEAVEKEQIRLGKLMGEHLTRELSGLIDWCKALSQEGKE